MTESVLRILMRLLGGKPNDDANDEEIYKTIRQTLIFLGDDV